MSAGPCPEPGCHFRPGHERHNHVCRDLNATGEVCWTCKVANWAIWFGHPLPTMIRCDGCGSGFNLSERLRQTTRPHPREARQS